MTIDVYSIFDSKACTFGMPFFRLNKGLAVRDFSDLVKDPSTSISKHPDDFKLYKLGTFDDNSGVLVSSPQPEFISNASDFVNVS